ncbi:MAG: DUF2314 domain-containing protein [Deltaproteobacteria bacterium]|nr:DUF2314 domain-containing protein [Deltaproteobacteria bacterium]
MIVILAALASANADAQAPALPVPPDARFALAYYCNPTCTGDDLDALDAALASIESSDAFSDHVGAPKRIMGLGGTDFGIPDADFVTAYGVGVDDPAALAASQMVVLAWFASPREQAVESFAAAHSAFSALARANGGWVEDLDTQSLFGAEAWATRDPRGPIDLWFVIEDDAESDDDPAVAVATRGLRRYGDFELLVPEVDASAAGDVSWALSAIATTLHPMGDVSPSVTVATESASGVATLELLAAPADDPTAAVLKVNFEGSITVPVEEPLPVEAAAPSVAAPIASEARAPVAAPTTLAEARAAVRAAVGGPLRDAFARGLADNEVIAVSVPFRTRNGGTEYLWVEVDRWEERGMGGRLATEPLDVNGLHEGDSVAINMVDIYDYVWKRADGSKEGNLTRPFRD